MTRILCILVGIPCLEPEYDSARYMSAGIIYSYE